MKIGLVSHTSKSTYHLRNFIAEVEKKIQLEFSELDVSGLLNGFIIGVNLSEFEPSDKLVTQYKSYKTEKQFEFTLNLKTEKYFNNEFEEFRNNFYEDLKAGVFEVFEKKIKNKNLGILIVSRIEKALFGKSTQNIDVLPILESNSHKVSQATEYSELEEKLFWELIEQSFIQGNSFASNIKKLEGNLCKNEDKIIIGFQITLRKLIDKLGSEFVISKAKKFNDYVTDDAFIYLRCKLISKGEFFFRQLEFETEDSCKEIYYFDEGEQLLYVADEAINIKYNNDYNSELPSYLAQKIHGPLL